MTTETAQEAGRIIARYLSTVRSSLADKDEIAWFFNLQIATGSTTIKPEEVPGIIESI